MSRPYEQMIIENIRGLTEAQQATLIAFGAQLTAAWERKMTPWVTFVNQTRYPTK